MTYAACIIIGAAIGAFGYGLVVRSELISLRRDKWWLLNKVARLELQVDELQPRDRWAEMAELYDFDPGQDEVWAEFDRGRYS